MEDNDFGCAKIVPHLYVRTHKNNDEETTYCNFYK